jgi:hypothetical protein
VNFLSSSQSDFAIGGIDSKVDTDSKLPVAWQNQS